jgi:hypothetical protein
MNIVVIGGTGVIGSKTVAILRQGGSEVVAASPKSAINTITGEGHVVVDLADSPSFEDKAVLEFFETSGRNLLAAEVAAGGVRHHVALSIGRHRRFKCGWKHSQDFARPVPAHRGGRRCCHRCGCGARSAAKRHRRDRRPGTSAVQRIRRPLSEGGRRPA